MTPHFGSHRLHPLQIGCAQSRHPMGCLLQRHAMPSLRSAACQSHPSLIQDCNTTIFLFCRSTCMIHKLGLAPCNVCQRMPRQVTKMVASRRRVGRDQKRVESNDEKHFTYLFNTRVDSYVGAVSYRLLDTKSSVNESWWALLPQRWSTKRRNAGADRCSQGASTSGRAACLRYAQAVCCDGK